MSKQGYQKKLVALAVAAVLTSSLQAESQVKVTEAKVTGAAAESQKVSGMISELANNRVRSYRDVSEPAIKAEIAKAKAASGISREERQADLKAERASTAESSKTHEFSLYAASVSLNIDQDGDGYYSDFSVRFDADTDFSYAYVFADLYLSRDGGPWELYYTTDVFEINGYSGSDVYKVRTLLTDGFPPGSYDVLIDLCDDYDGALVATLTPDDEYRLGYLPLEDLSYEDYTPSYSDYSIFDARVTLLVDQDNDGFYSSFSLQFDADVESGEAQVYAEIWIKDDSGYWQLDYSTDDFWIDGYSTLDTYITESELESGYATGYYDFRVDLYESDTGALVASTSSVNVDLSDVPLEDASRDTTSSNNNTGSGGGGSVSSGSGGGGSMGWLLLTLLGGARIRRYLNERL